MAYASTVRVSVTEGAAATAKSLVQQMLANRRHWQTSGDLLRAYVFCSEDQAQFELVSIWASKAAHDRHEDDPAEAPLLRQLVPHLTGQPSEVAGEVVAELA